MSRLPVVGSWVRPAVQTQAPRPLRAVPLRLWRALRPGPPPAYPELPVTRLVAKLVARVERPLARTVDVVHAARASRQPATRWERLRDAARLTWNDPAAAARWEHLLGLGLGLTVPTSPTARASGRRLATRWRRPPLIEPPPPPPGGLRRLLRAVRAAAQASTHKNPGSSRGSKGRRQR